MFNQLQYFSLSFLLHSFYFSLKLDTFFLVCHNFLLNFLIFLLFCIGWLTLQFLDFLFEILDHFISFEDGNLIIFDNLGISIFFPFIGDPQLLLELLNFCLLGSNYIVEVDHLVVLLHNCQINITWILKWNQR